MKYEKNGKIIYEVGDFVYLTCTDSGHKYLFEITEIEETLYRCTKGYYDYEYGRFISREACFHIMPARIFRPATQEEIEKAIKPVFKEKDKYEIGDWVTRTKETFGGMEVGDTGQVIGLNPRNPIISRYSTEKEKGHDPKNLRLATEEEIKKASKFRAGDWVALITSKDDVEAVVQLTKVNDDSLYYEPYDGMSFGCWGNYNDGRVRFATWDEIQKALKDKEIKIGEHTVEFDLPKRIVKVGCQFYPYDDVVALHKMMSRLDIKSITHSKIVEAIQYETINKIYRGIKNAGG